MSPRNLLASTTGDELVRASEVRRLDEDIQLQRYAYHTIELVIDRLKVGAEKTSRLAEAIEPVAEELALPVVAEPIPSPEPAAGRAGIADGRCEAAGAGHVR